MGLAAASWKRGSKLTIADVHRPEAFVEVFTNELGEARFTVPNKKLRVTVSAPGYISWKAAPETDMITLGNGEHRRLVFELEPSQSGRTD